MSTSVSCERTGPVASIQFRAEDGIQKVTRDVRTNLRRIVEELHGDRSCRLVVFESAGRTFLAGADVDELNQLTPESALEFARDGQSLMTAVENLPMPTVAAIHAACVGGGCELALACDVRFAADTARIGLPEVGLGIVPGWGGTVRAVQQLGALTARRLITVGQLIEATHALRIGLVDFAVPEDQFADGLDRLREQLLRGGSHAVAMAKSLMRKLSKITAADYAAEATAFATCYASGEPQEGTSAFLAKRAADWEGSEPVS